MKKDHRKNRSGENVIRENPLEGISGAMKKLIEQELKYLFWAEKHLAGALPKM